MNTKVLWLVVVVIAAAAAVYVALPTKPVEATVQVDPKIVDANTDFGFRVFKELVNQGGGKTNVVISPASLSLALSMTYNGASGSTKTAMAKTLGYSGLSLDIVNSGNKALLANMQSPGEGIELSVANSLWARKGVEFRPGFMQRNRDFFGAEVSTLDFDEPAAKDTINSWVNEKTRGKIDRIVDQIDSMTVLFLINAVYFKGIWTKQFDKSETLEARFTLADGSAKNMPMMHITGQYEYLQANGLQLINLPYGRGRMSMYVLLPARGQDLSRFAQGLTPENWAKWMKQIHGRKTEVTLSLPRYRIEYQVEAVDALCALGMCVACGPAADFSAMSPEGKSLYIKRVTHKTFVDVNEQGTEAAAATKVEIAIKCARPELTMVVDRPFFFAIRDNMTGEMLFVGSVAEPK